MLVRRLADILSGSAAPAGCREGPSMRAHVIVGLALLGAAAGCSTVQKTLTTTPSVIDRPATDIPGQFTLQNGALNGNAVCQSPLLDPRDQTVLQLVQPDRGEGNYQVPDGKYGVAAGELLRVDCTTGRALGILKAK